MSKFGMVSWDELNTNNNSSNKKDFKNYFLKLKDGDNVVRLLTKPFEFQVHQYKPHKDDEGYGKRILSCAPAYGDASDPLIALGIKPKRKWLVGVIDRSTSTYKVLEIGPGVLKSIQTLYRDEDWGDPIQYDVNIKVDKKAPPANYYNVNPKPKKPLSAADLELKQEVDLDDLKKRTSPPTPEEMLKKIQEAHATSKAGPFIPKSDDKVVDHSSEDEVDDEDLDFPSV